MNQLQAPVARKSLRLFLLSLGAVAGGALLAPAAWAGACVAGPAATYEAAGFSCNVGPVTFSEIAVSTPVTGSGSVGLGNFSPITFVYDGVEEYALSLSYTANTGSTPNSAADVAWTYDVSGTPDLVDAYMSFTGTTTGTGTISLSETLSNGVVLSLDFAGTDYTTFYPIESLSVIKDQNDFAGSAGSAESSLVENAFSVSATPVPEPASLALLGGALVGFGAIRRKRRGRA